MKAMVLTAPGELVLDEVARPARGAGDVLVRVTHSGICGTDYKIFTGSIPVSYPRIMGHEMAHALREHARERMGKTAATRIGASVLSAFLGLGNTGDALLNMGGQLLTLKFSREDESEADIVGMELAARAGFDPAAGVSLWQKMMNAAKGAPPQFLSTHPAGETRIRDIQAKLPRVQPIYARAGKPDRQFGPPKAEPASSSGPQR